MGKFTCINIDPVLVWWGSAVYFHLFRCSVWCDEWTLFCALCGLQTLQKPFVSFVSSQKNSLRSEPSRCLFRLRLSWNLPDFSYECILNQHYINHNITQRIGLRRWLECLRTYWITQPAIEICRSYVPITTYWEGSNLRGCSLRLSKGFKALPGIVYCNRYARCNEMFCRF